MREMRRNMKEMERKENEKANEKEMAKEKEKEVDVMKMPIMEESMAMPVDYANWLKER